METVWIQNLKGFIKGTFPADERWKTIFIEQLEKIDAAEHHDPVAVKPLEWEDVQPGLYRAQTNIIACYSVWEAGGYWECSLIDGRFTSAGRAKAAANADWETRVCAAIKEQEKA
jgi:hypothetical protein